MAFKRGFKSQCERRSTEIRKQLNIATTAPLKAAALADYIGVTIWSLDDIKELDEADYKQLAIHDPDTWSAFTLQIENEHLIVFNSSQGAERVNSVCMHELSHILLGHRLHDAHLSDRGHLVPGNFSKDQEDEADWLAGTLLLPRPALIDIRSRGLTDYQVKDEYLVSFAMIKWRFRMTGVDYQLSNRGYRGRSA